MSGARVAVRERVTADERSAPGGGRSEAVLLVVSTVLCLAPFVAKPLHLDDPLFYWEARQIAAHPLDPYGFTVNWYVRPEPMAAVTRNPPGASYYLAVAGTLLGWSPVALHAAFLLPAVAVVVGTWALGRRLCRQPVLPALLVLTSPGFLVSATSLMSDVPMLALWLLATVLWLEGIERDRPGLLAVAGIAAAACVLTKYPGAGVVPLLVVYALARRGWGRWTVALAPTLVLVLAYQYWSATAYGQGHLVDSFTYAEKEREPASLHGALVALAFVGGALPAMAALLPFVADGRTTAIVAAVGAAAGTLVVSAGRTWWDAGRTVDVWWPIGLHFAVFVAAGAAIVALAARDLARRRDAAAVVLALWVVGIVVFAGFVNWMANVRSVLPAIPAAALLVARALDDRRVLPMVVPATLVASLALAIWIAVGDYQIARAQVRAADLVVARTANRSGMLWFQGHWGFQAAMEERGGRAVDAVESRFFPGDVLVVPRTNTNVLPLPRDMPARSERLEIPIAAGGTTICGRCGAGFYSSLWGPLPYRIDPPPPERYDVVDVLPGGP